MARAIFGTSPKNEKKCTFSKIPKVTFGKSTRVLFDGNTFPGDITHNPKLYPLMAIGSHSKPNLNMEFFFFFANKLKNIVKENQDSDGKNHFELLI